MNFDELLRECAALRAKLEELKTIGIEQDAIRQSEERLRLAVEASDVGVFDFDPASGKQTFSPTALKIWGFAPDSLTDPEHVLAAIHPDDRAKTQTCAEQSLDPNGSGEFVTEHRLIRPDGTERWLSVSAKAIFAGKPDQRHAIRAVGTMFDVTARKQAESRLLASEERLRVAIDVAGLGMISVDYTTQLCTLDLIAANLFGFEPNKPIERSQLHQRIHSQDRATVMQLIDRALDPTGDGNFAVEHRIVLPSGEERWLAAKKIVKFAQLNGQRRPLTSLVTVMNVAARKQSEQLLQEHNQQLALLGRVAHQLILESRSETELLKQVFADTAKTVGAELYFYFESTAETAMRLGTWENLNGEEQLSTAVWRTIETLSEQVSRLHQPVVTTEFLNDESTRCELAKVTGFGACASFPLLAADRLLGTVTFATRRAAQFRGGDLATIEAVCSLVSTTLERMRLSHELRQSEQRYRTIIDATSAVTWACPPDGLHVRPQPSWMSFTGQSSSEMLGDGWTKAIHPEDLGTAFSKWNEAVIAGRPFTNEHRIRRHDGQWRWMSVCVAPICDAAGNIVEWFGMCLDVTTRKHSEERLRNADRRKDEFLATLAHELRNPLTPIKAGVDILKLCVGDPATVENARAMMERQVEQMSRLIDDLMDVSRIRSGKIVLQKSIFLLNRAIQIATETSRVLIDKKKQHLIIELPDEPIYVNCDLARLSQVLANLLNNAAKYTDIEGHIRLSVQRFGNDVRIQVEDNGIGIPNDMLERVFELFSQVDSSLEKSHGGLGIGLTLAKRLIEMHQGTLTAASEGPGQGSTFTVHLHNAASDRGGPLFLTSQQTCQPSACLKILVIDDHADVAEVLVTMLSLIGHSARIACDGVQGLTMAESLKPDVIIMDLGMPKLSGFETCLRIRQQPWGKDMLIVALSGWGDDRSKRKGLEHGFDHYITKPVALDELANLLSMRRQRDDNKDVEDCS